MAFTKKERQNLISEIVSNDDSLEGQEKWLESLTDNQLVALQQPDELDNMVTLASNSLEEDDDDDDEPDTNEVDDDDDESDVTLDDVIEATLNEMVRRGMVLQTNEGTGKKKKGKKAQKPTCNEGDCDEPDTNQIDEQEWLENAPENVRRLVTNAQRAEDEERASLIEIITANEANDFTEDQLKATPIETLESLAKLAHVNTSRPTVNYGGRSGGNSLVGNSRHVEAPLSVPNIWAD